MSFLLALAALAATTGAAEAGKRRNMACQKNLGDGRVLVANGDQLPDGVRFKVLRYRPNRTEDGWSYGPCVIELR